MWPVELVEDLVSVEVLLVLEDLPVLAVVLVASSLVEVLVEASSRLVVAMGVHHQDLEARATKMHLDPTFSLQAPYVSLAANTFIYY